MAHLRRFNVLANHLDHPPLLPSVSLVDARACSRREQVPVVIGGMVLDIQATAGSQELQTGTTTPGEVVYVRGGVGRNIAECLIKLDAIPFFISVVGDDVAGKFLLEHWESLGVPIYDPGIRVCSGFSTPVISAVMDKQGELAAAVADTRTVETCLTPEWIRSFASEIHSSSLVVVDANLDYCSIKVACELAYFANVPVWFEPVSVAKCVRATDVLPLITYVSPNEQELVAMCNALPTQGKSSVPDVCLEEENTRTSATSVVTELHYYMEELLKAGVKHIILTLGRQGAVLCSPAEDGEIMYLHYPALSASVAKLTGAGDTLVAGTVAALLKGKLEAQALSYGVAAAKLTVESDMNVAPLLSWTSIAGLVSHFGSKIDKFELSGNGLSL